MTSQVFLIHSYLDPLQPHTYSSTIITWRKPLIQIQGSGQLLELEGKSKGVGQRNALRAVD